MENINWNELRDRAYQCAVNHGWHEEKHSCYHYMMLFVSELGEVVNADRIGKHADITKFNLTNEPHCFKESFETFIKDTVEDELADAVMRLLDLAKEFGYDIDNSYFTKEHYDEISVILENHSFTEILFCIVVSLSDSRTNLSDTLYYLWGIAYHLSIDLPWFIEQKMKYNELRPYKHGNKKY